MSINTHPRLLVTGASGNLGREVVEQLLKAGTKNVVAGSRNPEALAELAAKGAETVTVDFDDPTSLSTAFAGVDRVLIISVDAKTSAEDRLRRQLAAVAAAVEAKVERIVYTSMLKPEPGSLIAYAPIHYATEQAIERSGIPFTILRVNAYTDNVFWWLPPILASGQWTTAAGRGRTAYIDRRDVARAAAAVLTSSEVLGRIDLGGAEALSANEIAAIVDDVFDITVTLDHVTDEVREQGLISAGLPPPVAKHLTAIDATTRQGDFDSASDLVERLTGTRARSFQDFLIEKRVALSAAANPKK
ncbi:NAD(P)-dependent oxidoreductase [Pseudomonas sp. Ost2]|uniref:SDR family NAD(P)-dependent oxidoreductase n=1 Tax=Pseudomonas sp. Ost2 TaxID=2678260 RepID=UPI001BB456BD|nr:SDR family NAD(P)-dependent oxidoreductase [Pseudomonas sp. Ost2]BBP74715.1 NAD(P)-dependent oxidoreductase [Pseudomonas sp. Ost2]